MKRPLGSLRARVFATTAVVAVLPIAAALLLVSRGLTGQAEAELAGRLEEGARLVAQYHRARLDLAAQRARLVADLPKLKAAVSEADPDTAEPVARDYREQVGSDVFVVADRAGRTLVGIGTDAAAWATGGGSVRVDGGRLIETVHAPIVLGAPPLAEHLGVLTLGFALDDAVAAQLAALTGAQVAIVHEGRVFASTLPRALDAPLALQAGRAAGSGLDLDGEEYAGARTSLGDGPIVLVLRSRSEAQRPLRTLRVAVTLAAVGAMVVSVLLSWAVARTVTRPLAAVTATMREIAVTGDLARPVAPPQPWDDEDATLLAHALGTLTSSIARFQQQAALRDRLSALGRLSTVIAHEIRNPLMIIKGSLRTLKREGAPAAEVREAAVDIEQEVARLNRVVGDVLDFARPLKLELSTVDPAALAERSLRAALDGRDDARGRLAIDPGTGTLVTDGERLRSVLVNLLENALDSVAARRQAAVGTEAAAAGEEAPSTDIELGACRLESGLVRFWVQDAGAGIAEADLPRVFEPYFTTKRTGTGLGLAIVRKVIEALGGTIRVESRQGIGTRVEIELPPELRPAATEAP
jgi:signal transduction histidine kinase